MTIRDALPNDAEELLSIYAPYVQETAISFEYVPPDVAQFQERMKKAHVYLVAQEDGEILGYCYAAPFHPRRAYERTVEASIYIRRDRRRSGIGKRLYEALDRRLCDAGFTNVIACVASPRGDDEYLTRDSALFHQRCGFTECGHLHRCGYKFGHWYDMLYFEKFLKNDNEV